MLSSDSPVPREHPLHSLAFLRAHLANLLACVRALSLCVDSLAPHSAHAESLSPIVLLLSSKRRPPAARPPFAPLHRLRLLFLLLGAPATTPVGTRLLPLRATSHLCIRPWAARQCAHPASTARVHRWRGKVCRLVSSGRRLVKVILGTRAERQCGSPFYFLNISG